MLISHYWYSGGVKEFDTNTGTVSTVTDVNWGETGFGSIFKQNGKYFAFYRDDKSLLLQHKENKWRVNPEYTVSISNYLFLRNFTVKHNGITVFSMWYKPRWLLLHFIDPTHDDLDSEADDFFLHIMNMWKHQ